MYFTNDEHKRNYELLMSLYKLKGDDIQYQSNIYIAAVPEIFECFDESEIDTSFSPLFALMEWDEEEERHVFCASGLTGSTRRMCELGLSLYNGYLVSLDDVFGSVASDHLVDACIEAIRIRARKYW